MSRSVNISGWIRGDIFQLARALIARSSAHRLPRCDVSRETELFRVSKFMTICLRARARADTAKRRK